MNQENFIKSGISQVLAGSDVSRKKKAFAKSRKGHPARPVVLKAGEEKGKKSIQNDQKIDVII
jgi:hypothetical protein